MNNLSKRGELTRNMHINRLTPTQISLFTTPELTEQVVRSRQLKEQYMRDQILDEPPLPEPPLPEPIFLGNPTNLDYVFDGHAGAGPSGAERWATCTASLGAVRGFLETLTTNQQVEFAKASMAARQGTTAHAAAEAEARVILGESIPEEADATLLELSIMPDTEGEAYNDEMAEYIAEYLDLVRAYVDSRGADNVLIETRLEAVIPLMTVDADGEQHTYTIKGSGDCVVLPTEAEPVLIVDDLKYGEGVDVDVDSNPQIRIYAIGALALLMDDEGYLTHDIERIEYHIVQPRLGGIKTWTESVEDLLTWRDEVLSPALTEALGGPKAGARFNPGEVQCQWCPFRGACPALAAQRMEAASELFDVITDAEFEDGPGAFPETAEMSDEQIGSLLTQVNGLVKIKDALKEEVQRRLHRGAQVPGFLLVNYTPARKWKAGADEALLNMDAVWQRKLLSPPAVEKLKDFDYSTIEELVDKPDIRPIVAAEGTNRKAWSGKPPEQMFADESDTVV